MWLSEHKGRRPRFVRERRLGKRLSRKREKTPTVEDKIKNFVIRNSRNGFFTKVQTLSFKFEIPKEQAWELSASLLADNVLECVHDEKGEPKLCEAGKSFEVLQKEVERRKSQNFNKKRKTS